MVWPVCLPNGVPSDNSIVGITFVAPKVEPEVGFVFSLKTSFLKNANSLYGTNPKSSPVPSPHR